MYKDKRHIHFMGIGGIGMSGIASILAKQRYTVSGCDLNIEQQSIKQLKELSCTIASGHMSSLCLHDDIDVVVYSTAVPLDHPELIAARNKGIIIAHRSEILAELMKEHYSIAVTGSHGKTTTSSLIAHITTVAHQDPTVIVGGHIPSIGSNARYGTGKLLIAEADESDRSLLNLFPSLAIITNISLEHLETYHSIEDIKKTFLAFTQKVPSTGAVIICIDDINNRSIIPLIEKRVISYSVKGVADLYATNIQLLEDRSIFDLHYYGTYSRSVTIPIPGIHNVSNSLAVIAACLEIDLTIDEIISALASFKGVDRRFTYHGTFCGADIFDDYGHHPVEIHHTLAVARRRAKGKLIVVFQPHRYSRSEKLFDQFVQLFCNESIDHLIITDIYAASETPVPGVTGERFVEEIKKLAPAKSIIYNPIDSNFMSIKKSLHEKSQPGDLILLLGAGNISSLIKGL